MSYMDEIKEYGEDIQDFEVSPFEMVETLQWRSHIVRVYDQLSIEEKEQLALYDLVLLSNAKKTYEYLRGGYNFPANKPIEEWWWHLDKVITGGIVFSASETNSSFVD
ncbi:hypothetical protein [Bacillus toyonensis]|uniref:hypothetical protein n=1 Tax=Bacillus toyonensis TaxID=155322 RepID=UPI002E1E7E8D|nr:hypothetical protein [Bacillus toyonensis]